jgi:hypothetical protein
MGRREGEKTTIRFHARYAMLCYTTPCYAMLCAVCCVLCCAVKQYQTPLPPFPFPLPPAIRKTKKNLQERSNSDTDILNTSPLTSPRSPHPSIEVQNHALSRRSSHLTHTGSWLSPRRK